MGAASGSCDGKLNKHGDFGDSYNNKECHCSDNSKKITHITLNYSPLSNMVFSGVVNLITFAKYYHGFVRVAYKCSECNSGYKHVVFEYTTDGVKIRDGYYRNTYYRYSQKEKAISSYHTMKSLRQIVKSMTQSGFRRGNCGLIFNNCNAFANEFYNRLL